MKRLPPQALYAVPETVLEMRRRFQYPDMDTIAPLAQPGAGGGGMLSLVVAASDAPDAEKAKADYFCSGSNDQDTIQQAIDVLQLAPIGGTIQLTSGHFYCTQTTADSYVIGTLGGATNDDGFGLIGMGMEATIIEVTGTAANGSVFLNYGGLGGSIIGNFTINNDVNIASNYACLLASNYARYENIKGYIAEAGANNYFIQLTGDENTVTDCNILFAGVGIWVEGTNSHIARNNIYTTVGISVRAGYTSITNNHIEGTTGIHYEGDTGTILGNTIIPTTTGVELTNSQSGLRIADNAIVLSVSGNCITGDGTHVLIEGNYLEGTGWGVHNVGDADWLVANNIFVETDGCLFEVNANNCQVVGNRFDTSGQVLFDGGAFTGCQVADNVWDVARSPAVDGVIVFDNGATDCAVVGNVIADASGMDGIRIETGTDCLIADNFVALADKGIVVNNGTRVKVTGNEVKWSGEHGIDYDGDSGTVTDNQAFGSSQNTTNTWDNFNISGDANLIHGNHSLPALVSPFTRYGINIVSGNDNAVYANALGDSSLYATADSIDSGTATQTTPAAGAIGGQFAY